MELDIIKDRVADLIGTTTNPLENGRYREAILKRVIKQFLPSNISIGTGFVIKEPGSGRKKSETVSRQIDLILYDNELPMIFSEGDFVIVTPKMVRGIIEVKSSLTLALFRTKVLESVIHNSKILNKENDKNFFSGLFVFKEPDNPRAIVDNLWGFCSTLNHIAWGTDHFFKYWEGSKTFVGYELKKLAFSYFISNLVTTIAGDHDDQYWIRFPLKEGKDPHEIGRSNC